MTDIDKDITVISSLKLDLIFSQSSNNIMSFNEKINV